MGGNDARQENDNCIHSSSPLKCHIVESLDVFHVEREQQLGSLSREG
jgi:hypothetical protein